MTNPRITQEEIGIIKKAQDGDIKAFNKLFRRYKSFVDNVLFQYLKDMDEAKDLTNIVFLKVYNKLSTFTAYSSFGGWLRIIANRTAIDYLREMKNKLNVLGDEDVRLTSSDSIGCDEIDLVNRLTYNQILEYFSELPENAQKICELFYVNCLTVEQISKELDIPTGTIKSILSRTRAKIKQHFKQV